MMPMRAYGLNNVMAAIVLLVAAYLPMALPAQDVPEITEKQKSVVLFDLRIEDMLAEAAELDLDAQGIGGSTLPPPFFRDDLTISDVRRVFGAASLPQSVEDAMKTMGPPGVELPFEFFVRVQFNDAETLEKFENEFKRNSETVEFGGKEYYSAGANAPPNVVAHRADETSFEVGTIAYCQQAKRAFFTDRLKAAYKTAPNHPIRIVADLETPAPLLNELVALGKQQFSDPLSLAYLDLVDNAESLALTYSLTAQHLVSLIVEGKNEDEAKELAAGIDGLLGTAKIGVGPMIAQVNRDDPEMREAMSFVPAMVESLAANQDGTTVKLLVPRPDDFEEKIGLLQTALRARAMETSKLNDFRHVGLSVHNYEFAHGEFPFRAEGNRHKDFSWRGVLLPYLEQNEMYDQMDPRKSPAEEPNSKFVDKMPKLFGTGGKLSHVAWIESKVETFESITDGTSNTIMLIENPAGQPWLEQNSLTVEQAIRLVKDLPDGEKLAVVLYDGATTQISNKINEEELRNVLTPDDGNVVDFDWFR